MTTHIAHAFAHPNIALVKYWGKRDERRILPFQSSLSVTLAPLRVQTKVAFEQEHDEVHINGREAKGLARKRVLDTVAAVRKLTRVKLGRVRVESSGDFPEGAGLASSAAAFAALALAAREAAGLEPDVEESSRLARLGSGSACRSIEGGFCVWERGRAPSGQDSFARQVYPADHWPDLRLVVALVSRAEKDVASRDGMRRTVETSPFYAAWVKDAEASIGPAKRFIARRDLEGLGALAERNAWRMHATALGAKPPLCYLLPGTLALVGELARARAGGLPVWFTLDAGPNPVLLTDAAHEEMVCAWAMGHGASELVRCRPGGDAWLEPT